MSCKSKVLRASLAALILIGSATLAAAQVTVIHRFTGVDGYNPVGGLTLDDQGNLYGATPFGGNADLSGGGTIFRLSPPADPSRRLWSAKVLHRFPPQAGEGFPTSGVTFGPSGALYGSLSFSGGLVYRLSPPNTVGQRGYEPIFSFGPAASNIGTGLHPNAVIATVGLPGRDVVYGTATEGGVVINGGVLFQLAPQHGQPTWNETILYNFCSQPIVDQNGNQICSDGANPFAPPTIGPDGNFYGTTLAGGNGDHGAVYRIEGDGTITILHSFCTNTVCQDGSAPESSLIFDANNSIYGTATACSGTTRCHGTVFRLTPQASDREPFKFSVIHSFCLQVTSSGNCADGALPRSGLVMDANGALYGVAEQGGKFGGGVIYKLTPGGNGGYSTTVLHSFGAETSGLPHHPNGTLLLDPNTGILYGATAFGGNNCGGTNTCGTIFQVIPP